MMNFRWVTNCGNTCNAFVEHAAVTLIDSLMQDPNELITNAINLLQYSTMSSIWGWK